RLVVGNLRQRVEAVDCRIDRAAFFRQQRLGSAPDRFAIVDHKDLEALKACLRAYCVTGRHALLLAVRAAAAPIAPWRHLTNSTRLLTHRLRGFQRLVRRLEGCRPKARTSRTRLSKAAPRPRVRKLW